MLTVDAEVLALGYKTEIAGFFRGLEARSIVDQSVDDARLARGFIAKEEDLEVWYGCIGAQAASIERYECR